MPLITFQKILLPLEKTVSVDFRFSAWAAWTNDKLAFHFTILAFKSISVSSPFVLSKRCWWPNTELRSESWPENGLPSALCHTKSSPGKLNWSCRSRARALDRRVSVHMKTYRIAIVLVDWLTLYNIHRKDQMHFKKVWLFSHSSTTRFFLADNREHEHGPIVPVGVDHTGTSWQDWLIGHSHDGQIFDGYGHVRDNRSQSWVVGFTRKRLTIVLVGWLA